VDIPGEKEGLVPNADWKKRTLKTPWYPGETISVSIGQGQLQVTPLQLAELTAVIANRGTRRPIPHFLIRGTDSPVPPPEGTGLDGELPFKPATFESVIEGMWRSVNNEGTGQGAFVAGWDVCGKTGSTQVVGRERAERLAKAGKEIRTHSWFCGFAPRVHPRIVVTVLVEFGGGGGATAAPLAGQIFGYYKEHHLP
jgi:penicillin-binding protein 2